MKLINVSVLFYLLSMPFWLTAGEAWETKRLSSEFYAEGSCAGDINGDGVTDLVYGPRWWAGPDFDRSFRFTATPEKAFIADRGYSDNFFSFTLDANGDGKTDILVFGFPGKDARLYINPGGPGYSEDRDWEMHLIAPEISNESPTLIDIVPGGLPEIVCTKEGTYGFYEADKDATEPWTWRAISPKGSAAGRFEHGLGVGDVDGDGRLDILQREFWFQNTGGIGMWKKHRWALPPQPGGAQILVDDVDGDGDADIITSHRAHGYGFAWFEQYEPGKFQPHQIMGERSTDNPFGVCFSQLHALALADMDGDGRSDVVTGKRYLAHQGKDPGGLEAPVLYWFRNTKKGEEVEFVPHLVDDDSGVGVEVKVLDLNGDKYPDIISGNKKGLAIHLQNRENVLSNTPKRWAIIGGRPQDNYGTGMSAEEAVKRMAVPEGFFVDLIAAEPDVTQPIAMTFDARGRIWMIEGHTYPVRAASGEGKDRILIFEDTDGDGGFDSRKVFAEGINLASGIEIGFGGVYVGAAPYLYFFPDKDGDDKPDSEPEILLDGWGYQDTHETLNAFTWGPDGWLYGCQGVFTHSKVGKPGSSDDQRLPMNAGVWRFHPVSKEFEVFAHGTSNPWGVDFNEYGDCFVSACVIPHFFHLTKGGLYRRQAGQHFNPWAFDDIKTIADHAHYAGNIREHAFWGANRAARPKAPSDTSALGGGHAHCGLALYLADTFPDHYRGSAFFHNLHGHRIVREKLETKGSGYIARHRPDFVLSNDHDFVGVGVKLGPDGALYYSDWVDPQTCHHRDVEIWNRSNGRIYRVRYGAESSTVIALIDKGDDELVGLLAHPNGFIARQAQKLLQERAAAGLLKKGATETALVDFENNHRENAAYRLRALWTRHVTGLLTGPRLVSAFDDESEYVRGWAVQLAEPNGDLILKMEEMAANDISLWVRRHLASKLQELPLDARWSLAENLIAHGRSGHDPNIPMLCWYGIEPLVEHDSARAFALANKTRWPQLKDFISRRAVVTPGGRESIMKSLSRTNKADIYAKHAEELLAALSKMPPVEQPKNWSEAKAKGKKLGEQSDQVAEMLSRLGARFGDEVYFPKWREVALNRKAKVPRRDLAIDLLIAGKDPQIGKVGQSLLGHPLMYRAAMRALRADSNPSVESAKAVVEKISEFPLGIRNDAINWLASRAESALVLLKAVDEDKVEASLVSPVLLNQFDLFKDKEIDTLIAKNWSRGGASIDLAQLKTAIEAWTKKLSPKVMAKADASRGRQVYKTTCGTCHQMFGEGIALGPDLTGSNRADLGYILENVLAPSAVVGKDYLLNIFTMKDGSTLSGMVSKETPDFYQLTMAGGVSVDVKKSEVEKRQEMPQSLMPAGLFDALPLESVADLVKYLSSPNQKSIQSHSQSSVPPAPDGVTRIEGESLLGKARPNGGKLTVQGMTHFGPQWSGNSHLWWTGGKPGDVLSFKLKNINPGTCDLDLFLTTANDYATIKVSINGQLQETDLFTRKVLLAAPLRFKNVNISPSEPLQVDIHITGKNDLAMPRFMVGIDRIEVKTRASVQN